MGQSRGNKGKKRREKSKEVINFNKTIKKVVDIGMGGTLFRLSTEMGSVNRMSSAAQFRKFVSPTWKEKRDEVCKKKRERRRKK